MKGTFAPFALANFAVFLSSVATTISEMNFDFFAASSVFLISGLPSKFIDLPLQAPTLKLLILYNLLNYRLF